MRRALATFVCAALLAACGSAAPPPRSALAAADAKGPGWARDGDAREGKAHLFVCQGQGKTEADALQSAGALCDDKICKLCGVQIESTVQTDESLTGVELKRQVVEKCRMIRTAEPTVTRKSVECGPGGCDAWIQVRYTDAEKKEACQRLEDGNFAGPEACQATIDAFSKVPGYSAKSFRERVRLIDRALVDCAQIDVRPTPLMGSLDAKLKTGMTTFNGRDSDAPGFLKTYWLAPFAPLWTQYEQSPKFLEWLKLLRGYLAHKVLIMDVVEASSPEDLDTKAAVSTIARVCEAVPPDEAYGTAHVQFLAVEALYDRFFTGRLSTDVEPVSKVVRAQYPPESLTETMQIAQLFSIGGRIDATEWAYVSKTRVDGPAARRVLEVPDHGAPETRRQRFREALDRALEGVDARRRVSRFKHVVPNDAVFFLAVEADLAPDLRAVVDFDFLKDLYGRGERKRTRSEAGAVRARMVDALKVLPADAKARRTRCLSLADDLKFLDEQGTPTLDAGFGPVACECLTGPLGDEGLSLVNKSALYERALRERLPCVAPLP
jgi:hypothetical protein